MVVPSNFTAILNFRNKTDTYAVVSKSEARKMAQKTTKQDYLHLVMLRPESEETQGENLISWSVSDANSKDFKIVLEFGDTF